MIDRTDLREFLKLTCSDVGR